MENGLENIQSGREEPVSGHCVNLVGSSLSKEVVAETQSWSLILDVFWRQNQHHSVKERLEKMGKGVEEIKYHKELPLWHGQLGSVTETIWLQPVMCIVISSS